MSIDAKLIVDAMSKLFDELAAGLFKQDAAREASRGVPVPAQSVAVRADPVANNSDEQHHEEPIVADNWGGLFEQPHFQEERDLEFPDAPAPEPESCLASTESDALAGVVLAVSSSSSSAPTPAPVARAAHEEHTTSTTPTRCSTQVPTPTPTPVNNAAALVSSPAPPTNSPTMCSMVCLSQQRYITISTPAYSTGVVFPWLDTRVLEIQNGYERIGVLKTAMLVPATFIDIGQGPSILNFEQVGIPPKPPWSLHRLEYDSFKVALMPWTPLSVLPDVVQLRSIPWLSFWEYSVDMHWLQFFKNAPPASKFIWVQHLSDKGAFMIQLSHFYELVLWKLPCVHLLCIHDSSCYGASTISNWKYAVRLLQLFQHASLVGFECYQLQVTGIRIGLFNWSPWNSQFLASVSIQWVMHIVSAHNAKIPRTVRLLLATAVPGHIVTVSPMHPLNICLRLWCVHSGGGISQIKPLVAQIQNYKLLSSSYWKYQYELAIAEITDQGVVLQCLQFLVQQQQLSDVLLTSIVANQQLITWDAGGSELYIQLIQKHPDGSWCHMPYVLLLWYSVYSHWIQVQVQAHEGLYFLMAEIMFSIKGFYFIMEIKIKWMTSFKHLQAPWDPGGIDLVWRKCLVVTPSMLTQLNAATLDQLVPDAIFLVIPIQESITAFNLKTKLCLHSLKISHELLGIRSEATELSNDYRSMHCIKKLLIPWDPGDSRLLHRLGGKPNLKKGGMSGCCVGLMGCFGPAFAIQDEAQERHGGAAILQEKDMPVLWGIEY